ncbi:hypothetical protein Gotur_014019 [Gossypium turneri]
MLMTFLASLLSQNCSVVFTTSMHFLKSLELCLLIL